MMSFAEQKSSSILWGRALGNESLRTHCTINHTTNQSVQTQLDIKVEEGKLGADASNKTLAGTQVTAHPSTDQGSKGKQERALCIVDKIKLSRKER